MKDGDFSAFSGFDDASRQRFLAGCHRRDVDAGARLITQGEPVTELYFFEDGKVSITVEARGREREVAVIEGTNVLGELELLIDQKASASATALDSFTVYVLDRMHFLGRVLDGESDAVRVFHNVARALAVRLDAMNERMRHYLSNPSSMRSEQLEEFSEKLQREWSD